LYVDAHFHCNSYHRYTNDLEEVFALLNKHQILVVSNSTDPEAYKQNLELAKKSKFVMPLWGIHPQVAHDFLDKLDDLEDYFNEAIAYGEIGLDHYYLKDEEQYPAQYELLKHFFAKARDQNKLVALHLDGAEEQGLELIKEYSLKKVIVHGYKGSLEAMKELLDVGCYFSVGGNMIMDIFKSYMTEDDWVLFHNIVREVPENRLLVESDGPCRTEAEMPDDAPRSLPIYLFDILEQIAKTRKTTSVKLGKLTTENFRRLIKDDENLKSFYKLLQKQ
jgi:TatD DNase family protein